MPDITPLDAERVDERMRAELPAWRLDEGKLHRRIVCADFVAAFGLMSQVAMLAERADHHPEWRNVYKTVDIWLVTHEAGGITERDFALAAEIDRRASAGADG